MAYYCTKCEGMHRGDSGIGVNHKEYEGTSPFEVTGSTEGNELMNDLRTYVLIFPQIPYNHTPLKQEEARIAQASWIRGLKNLLGME